MDKALASSRQPAPFILAFDGFLMVSEDRLEAAQARFEECVDLAKQGEGIDAEYVIKWCRVWLSVYDEATGWEEIKNAAEAENIAWRKASKFVQVYLPRASIDKLEEICGHRKSKAKCGSSQPPTPTKTNTTIAFDL